MLLRIGSVVCFLTSYSLVYTTSVLRRQGPSELLTEYTTQVKTAIYVINNIQANNASSSCADALLTGKLDTSGYDGDYAQRLLCETAIGIQLFSNLTQASLDMQNALDGLNDLQNDGTSSSRLSVCQNMNIDTLEEAGLNGPGIRQVICNVPSSTSAVSAPTSSGDTSSSSTGMQQPPTPLISTTDSLQSSAQSPISKDSPTATSLSIAVPESFSTRLLSSTSSHITVSISTDRSMSGSNGVVSNTSQRVSSSINESTIPVVTVTNFTTTWITETALPSQSTMRTGNGTTTHTITSTSTIEVTITVIDRNDASIRGHTSASRRKPWQ